MLYAGTGERDGYVGVSAFNNSADSPAYIGWKYTLGSPDTLSTARGNGTPSTIYTYIKINWYDKLTPDQKSYINTSAVYCNDRNTDYSGTSGVLFPAYERIYNKQTPTFACTNTSDRFQDGFGLMTADELVYAGGLYNGQTKAAYYYSNKEGNPSTNNIDWWLMTPHYYSTNGPIMFYVSCLNGAAGIHDGGVGAEMAVRPVISLKSCVTVSSDGDGSGTNPYVVNGTC